MELMLKISVEEEKNDLKLKVFVWSQNIENQKLNDLSSPVANFKIPLNYVPQCEIASSDRVPNESREESQTKEFDKYAPHALQSNENENQSDSAIEAPAVSDETEQHQLQNSSNEIDVSTNSKSRSMNQPVVENEDPDVSMNLPKFMEYLKQKHQKIISNRNSPREICECGTSFLQNSELNRDLTRSNEWIQNPAEMSKEDLLVEIENEARNRKQSETDQVSKKYDIQHARTQRRSSEIEKIALKDTSERSPKMKDILPKGSNSKQNLEMNSNELDVVSVCSDDYTLLIDEDQPGTDVSPIEKVMGTKKQRGLVISPKVVTSTSPQYKRGQFWCQLCKRSFKRESSQNSHMNSYHRLKFRCKICHLPFAYRSQFIKHLQLSHFIQRKSERRPQRNSKEICWSLWQNSRLNAHNWVPKKLS